MKPCVDSDTHLNMGEICYVDILHLTKLGGGTMLSCSRAMTDSSYENSGCVGYGK
jgi:hypothetical protein